MKNTKMAMSMHLLDDASSIVLVQRPSIRNDRGYQLYNTLTVSRVGFDAGMCPFVLGLCVWMVDGSIKINGM